MFRLPILVTPVDPVYAPAVLGRNWLNVFYGKDFFGNVMQIRKYSINSLEPPKQFVPPPPPPQAGLNGQNINSWIAQFPAVNGKGTGRFKGEPVSISMIPMSQPKYHGARQVDSALSARVEDAIDSSAGCLGTRQVF